MYVRTTLFGRIPKVKSMKTQLILYILPPSFSQLILIKRMLTQLFLSASFFQINSKVLVAVYIAGELAKGILQNHTCTHSPSSSCETIILRDRRRVIIAIFTTAT